jgi:hypothetical protein
VIVRILGDAQYEVEDARAKELDDLDTALVKAVDAGDEAAYGPALQALIEKVRALGQELGDDAFVPSELVVPFVDSSLEETRRLLAEAGRTDEG